MDRFTSLTRLRVRLLTWRINSLRRLAMKLDQYRCPNLAGRLVIRVWRLETKHFRQRFLLGQIPSFPRPQMWLETHPPHDQSNPTPSSSS